MLPAISMCHLKQMDSPLDLSATIYTFNMTTIHTTEKGFVALLSIIIMSVVLLATTLSLAQFGIASRFFILDLEHKSASEKLAEACVHVARISVYNNPFYEAANINIPINTETCTIISIEADGDESIVVARGIHGKSVTNMPVDIDNRNGDFVSWTELATL